MRLGEFIKNGRWNNTTFGEKIGESKFTIRSWASNKTIPRPSNMRKIYEATNGVVDEYLDKDGNNVKYIGGCDE